MMHTNIFSSKSVIEFVKVFLALFMAVCASHATAVENLRLVVGDIRVLKIPDITRVAIADEDIVQYRPVENNELVLIASKPGSTNIRIWQFGGRQLSYSIDVAEKSVVPAIDFAKLLVRGFETVQVSSRHNRLVFTGFVDRKDRKTFDTIVAIFPSAISLVRTRSFDVEKIIRLDVQLLEISKRAASEIGIRWQDAIAGPAIGMHKEIYSNGSFSVQTDDSTFDLKEISDTVNIGDRGFYGYAGMTSAISSRIQLLASSGDARIIASPKLSAKSGATAKFRSGGQYPISVVDKFGQTSIEFKDYGITLEIVPTIDDQNIINTVIFTEVSAIDRGVTVQGVPGVTTRNTNTTINLGDGETFAISGLGYLSQGENVAKVPFLGDLPLLGGLFRSKGKDNTSTELVVLITPHVVTPSSEKNSLLTEFADGQRESARSNPLDSFLLD